MIYLETGSSDPHFNLAAEEYVFEQMSRAEEYFMLWQNRPSVIIGRYQNTAEEVNQAYVRENGIDVVRRLSGGGAVYHDMGNLNFTYIVNCADQETIQAKRFTEPVLETLKHFGVKAQCTGRNDITIDGAKFCGNAQYIKNGRLLYHGCIMVDTDLTKVTKALTPNPAKFESKSTKSVRSRVTTISRHAPNPVSMEDFKKTLRSYVMREKNDCCETICLGAQAEVNEISKSKYSTWEWNYGQTIPFTMRRQKKYPAGLVEAYLQADHGTIEKIRFYGDFFCNKELRELEEKLEGVRLDAGLESCLQSLQIQDYFCGIGAEELTELLR